MAPPVPITSIDKECLGCGAQMPQAAEYCTKCSKVIAQYREDYLLPMRYTTKKMLPFTLNNHRVKRSDYGE